MKLFGRWTLLTKRVLVLVAVASLAFGVGTILFATMVALFTPAALPFFLPYTPYLIGVPLIVGGVLLTLLEAW